AAAGRFGVPAACADAAAGWFGLPAACADAASAARWCGLPSACCAARAAGRCVLPRNGDGNVVLLRHAGTVGDGLSGTVRGTVVCGTDGVLDCVIGGVVSGVVGGGRRRLRTPPRHRHRPRWGCGCAHR
ncbi:hypothetical protein, partial [Corynebacterium bovis]